MARRSRSQRRDEIRFDRIPELERRIHEAARLDELQVGNRMLKEVDAEDIAGSSASGQACRSSVSHGR